MKPFRLTPPSLAVLILAMIGPVVDASGRMTMTQPRPHGITTRYRAVSPPTLKGFGDDDLLQMPIEELADRIAQASERDPTQPRPVLDLHNGCRGTIYEPDNAVTTLALEKEFTVQWHIAAPVPGGRGSLAIFRERKMGESPHYGEGPVVKADFPMGESVGPGSITARVPSDLPRGCINGREDKCVLQLKWTAPNQTFVSCADIVVTSTMVNLAESIRSFPLTIKKNATTGVSSK